MIGISSIEEIFSIFAENIQASFIIADEATREREFGNLRAIKDNYPKYVVSMTPLVTRNDDNGIIHLHLRKFLMEGLK